MIGVGSIFRYGAGPNGIMRTIGQYMAASGATFGYDLDTTIPTLSRHGQLTYNDGQILYGHWQRYQNRLITDRSRIVDASEPPKTIHHGGTARVPPTRRVRENKMDTGMEPPIYPSRRTRTARRWEYQGLNGIV